VLPRSLSIRAVAAAIPEAVPVTTYVRDMESSDLCAHHCACEFVTIVTYPIGGCRKRAVVCKHSLGDARAVAGQRVVVFAARLGRLIRFHPSK
jgi:hypothetical protein